MSQQKDSGTQTGPKTIYSKWLHRQKEAYIGKLIVLLESAGPIDQVSALAALLEFSRMDTPGVLNHELLYKIIEVVVTKNTISVEVLGSLINKYSLYADIHYFVCKTLKALCSRYGKKRTGAVNGDETVQNARELDVDQTDFVRTVYDILLHITPVLDEFGDELPSWCGASEVGILATVNDGSTKRQRKRLREEKEETGDDEGKIGGKWASRKFRQKAVSEAWLELLKLTLPVDIYRKVLTHLHDVIIPSLINPLLLSDFLTHALDRGGLDGMLALNGIFILVTQHGLEYPKFYERLYGLLTPDVFLSKHRIRFFQLADIFLASPMVPAYTAAAFAKRFARIGMRGSPATAIISIAFIHNILRRHPACMQIIHRIPNNNKNKSSASVWQGEDVYDEDEEDPAESRALESSLWEVTAFRNHADPSVSQYVSVLDRDISDRKKTSEINISEVLTASYASIFDKEINRRLKAVPTAAYPTTQVPRELFSPSSKSSTSASSAPWQQGMIFPGFKLT